MQKNSKNSLKSLWADDNFGLEFADFTSQSKEKIFVFWRPIQVLADAIYKWADTNAKIGSVESLVDICEDSFNKTEIFYKMPIEIVLKACYALQEVGKAEVWSEMINGYRCSIQIMKMPWESSSSTTDEYRVIIN